MSYTQLYYHLIWTTRRREPVLATPVEPVVYDAIRWKAVELGSAIYALDGTADHVHLVVAIQPRVAIDSFVRQVKSAATARFNGRAPEEPLHWDAEYGAMSFDGKRLPHVIAYVSRQKAHHAAMTLIPVLERTSEQPTAPGIMREPIAAYHADDENAAWWQEMLALEA